MEKHNDLNELPAHTTQASKGEGREDAAVARMNPENRLLTLYSEESERVTVVNFLVSAPDQFEDAFFNSRTRKGSYAT
jgi:hypothetical protein